MFSAYHFVVLLVVFVSQAQGQSSTAVAPNATSSVALQSTTVPGGNGPTSSITATTTPPLAKTCAKLGVTINLAWNEDYGNKSSETYKNLSKEFSSALGKLLEKHQDVKVSNVTFKNKTGKVFAEAKLCLVFTKGEDSIKDVFFDKLKTGKLSENLPVVKDSAEFEALEVEYKNYEAKEGECDKCDGAAGPFDIEGECVPDSKEFSCNGLEETKTMETEDCPTYCSSTALTVTVSSLILAIGILLSSSFQ